MVKKVGDASIAGDNEVCSDRKSRKNKYSSSKESVAKIENVL